MNWWDKAVSLLDNIYKASQVVKQLAVQGFQITGPWLILLTMYGLFYERLLAVINHVTQAANSGSLQGFAQFTGHVNRIYPVTEVFAMLGIYLSLKVATTGLRILKSLIPGWA